MCELTIITVCYNAYKELKATFDSVLLQTDFYFDSMEYIVVDNLSQDGTKGLLEEYLSIFKKKGCRFRYIREPDDGIYDAMNKGIKLAQGCWLMLLNAGDTLYNNEVLYNIKKHMHDDVGVLVGTYNRIDPCGEMIIAPPPIERLKNRMIFCHQAVIIRRKTQLDYLYNKNYKIVADYDSLLNMYLSGVRFKYINCCITNYGVTGLSAKRMIATHREMYTVRKDNKVIDNKIKEWLIFAYGLIKRIILYSMPTNLRWRIVGFWHRHFKKRYV